MKLVLIQGDYMAHYEGRKQDVIIHVDTWDFDVRNFIEDFRTRGEKAVG